jgi:hypothetical protein
VLPPDTLVKAMYQFAIDMGEENSYTSAAPKGEKSHEAL